MVVRLGVKLRNRAGGFEIEVPAIANAAYETERPEICIPMELAERLGIKIEEASIEVYEVVTGPVSLHFLPGMLDVSLSVEDKTIGPILSDVSIALKGEVLLSDKLIDALGVELVEPGKGLWRLSGEPIKRKSVSP